MSDESKWGTCSCGMPAQRGWRGRDVCWDCWNWGKLDGPAASTWVKVADEFLSTIDGYDIQMFFKKVGIESDEANAMIEAVAKLRDGSKALIDARIARMRG